MLFQWRSVYYCVVQLCFSFKYAKPVNYVTVLLCNNSAIRCLALGWRTIYEIYDQTFVRYLPFHIWWLIQLRVWNIDVSIVTDVFMLFKLTSAPFRHYMICLSDSFAILVLLLLVQDIGCIGIFLVKSLKLIKCVINLG